MAFGDGTAVPDWWKMPVLHAMAIGYKCCAEHAIANYHLAYNSDQYSDTDCIMPRPKIFISHRWDYHVDYYKLVAKFSQYGFSHFDYSVPRHNPADANSVRAISLTLTEQVRQCNYFIIFANRAISNSRWCLHELNVAKSLGKPILSINPFAYAGGTPSQIAQADNQGGPVGMNTPAIIRRICTTLQWPLPVVV